MSSKIAMEFGDTHQEEYEKIASKWAKKLGGSGKVSNKTRSEWGIDLQHSLGDQVEEGLKKYTLSRWKSAGKLPPKDLLEMYTKIAVKGALAIDTGDLLQRLKDSAAITEFAVNSINSVNSINRDNSTKSTRSPRLVVPLRLKTETSEFAVMQVPELLKRSSQTVAQIFDMAQDRFDGLIGRYFKKTGQASGKRQWVTEYSKSGPSRHAALNGQVKSENEDFIYEGEKVHGPRPPGGSPANWSNCGCRLSYELSKGVWT